MVVSFAFKPSLLLSFVLLFVAFGSSSCCGSSSGNVDLVVVVVEDALVVVVVIVLPSFPSSSSLFLGTDFIFAAAAAFLIFLHSCRCSPFFQCCTWHSRPQYWTVWHSLQGFIGRNGVLGLPHVEQQVIVGVVRPSCLSNI